MESKVSVKLCDTIPIKDYDPHIDTKPHPFPLPINNCTFATNLRRRRSFIRISILY